MCLIHSCTLFLLLCFYVKGFPYNDEEGSGSGQDAFIARPYPTSNNALTGVPNNSGSLIFGLSTKQELSKNQPDKISPKILPSSAPIWDMFKAWTNPEKREEPKDRDPSGLLDQEAWKRRMIWERAISRERSRSHPDQVLKIKQKELTRSKCQALPFIQNIFQKNCALLRIPNKFCFGQCNSFYLPGWPSSLPQPCASCVPSHSRRLFVTLRCQGGKRSRVAVEMIEECECLTRYGNEDETAPFGRTEGFLPL